MQTENAISNRYDEASPAYDLEDGQTLEQKLYWLAYDELTMRAARAVLPPIPCRVLDAGGGSGKYGTELARLGHHVTVLDLSSGMLEKAQQRFQAAGLLDRASFQVGNILALPFPDRSFDFVFCEGDPVSYTLDKHRDSIAELLRVVVDGGPILMGVDNRFAHFLNGLGKAPGKALEVLLTGKSTCPYGLPVHAFTLPELIEATRAAGAESVEAQGKPVLFYEQLEAMAAAHGPGFDPWAAREEIFRLQESLSRPYAALGGHFQVVARRPRSPAASPGASLARGAA